MKESLQKLLMLVGVVVLGLVFVAPGARMARSQSLSSTVQKIVATHTQTSEAMIGQTRAAFVEKAVATGMSCEGFDNDVICFVGESASGFYARFGPRGQVARYGVSFGTPDACAAAKGYMASRYGKHRLEEKGRSSSTLFYWGHPKRKNRLLVYEEFPPKTRHTPPGLPMTTQSCFVTYMVGELVSQ